ncbi:DUF3073 domain-containing protein [Actinosynnema sp. NPDC050436]|uniref:DUF3073 domain-containing protein n=1 Tax=Actinosynnema sp. NPDC050436 TaxID=3155659 RepID=UPI0033C7133B
MGRGRAKAKQTKVARELKYSSHNTDFDALQRELSGDSDGVRRSDERYDDASDDEYDDYRR